MVAFLKTAERQLIVFKDFDADSFHEVKEKILFAFAVIFCWFVIYYQ